VDARDARHRRYSAAVRCPKFSIFTAVTASALVIATTAGAVPPMLSSLSLQNRHAVATFSAPRADSLTIYLASKPDRATDGSFLQENIETLDVLTDSEIQSGRWSDEHQIDPGTYWVLLRASPDFDSCFIFEGGTLDPACADGFSNIQPLVVPTPASRYSASVTAYRFLGQATLRFTAMPLGEARPYRVCYRLKTRRTRCLAGSLDGFDWNSRAQDSLTIATRNLPAIATFTWFVAGMRVATKRVRMR
jgi:hypothetical protein